MILKPRKGFSFIVKFIDFFNPLIVLLSIAGLILEYTQYKDYVLYPNRIIDMVFVVDFLLRLISFPSGRYFFKSYGWVDFLASIPGFTAFMQFGQYFGLFKVMRIGRFFKIIRVLRFLRIFSFLKKMKGDSAFIQERIMKIGVTIVIVFVTGLGFTDYFITEALTDLRKDNINSIMELSRNKVPKLIERVDNVVYYSDNGVLYDAGGKASELYSDYTEKLHSSSRWYTELRFSDNSVDHNGYIIPVKGVLISADNIMTKHDNIMLILISSLILILVILIFYIGYIFARDMKIVQLINDSVDADDYWLLKEEAKKYSSSGELVIEEGEDEIISLIKMTAKLAENAESSAGAGLSVAGMESSMFADTDFSSDFADVKITDEPDTDFYQGDEKGGIGEYLSDSASGTGIEDFSDDEDVDTLFNDELHELADVIPDLNEFKKSAEDDIPVIGDVSSMYVDRENLSIEELPDSHEADGLLSQIAEKDESAPVILKEKLEAIEKTVNEINSKLITLENVQDQALESVARDAASRAVKITSKSIGEYIHKKLSGK